MPRPVREDIRRETTEEIKRTARQQMREKGTAGLSLRAIAREMSITAPAIYNYFPRMDDLITALIVDAFNAIADQMTAATEDTPTENYAERFRLTVLAYREWAIANPVQFQLIYGNPIPGYAAPADVTGPLARRPFVQIFEIALAAWQAGHLIVPPAYQTVPKSISLYVQDWQKGTGIDVPEALYYALVIGWTRIHGIVMLELFEHLQPAIGDPAALYNHEVDLYLTQLSLK